MVNNLLANAKQSTTTFSHSTSAPNPDSCLVELFAHAYTTAFLTVLRDKVREGPSISLPSMFPPRTAQK